MKTDPDISVIIASHRPQMIASLLQHLPLHNTTHPPSFEVIIVTDYYNTRLQTQFPHCAWLYIPCNSISKKRNFGIKAAAGKVFAFIDDDCIPSEDWLVQGFTFLKNHPDLTAVIGYTRIENRPDVSSTTIREYKHLENSEFRTNNLFFRAEQLKKIGCFDERFSVQREDTDLAFTTIEHGLTYTFHSSIRVTHRIRPGEPWDLLKNCWNRRFDPLLYKKHPQLYRRHIGSPLTPGIKIALPLYCSLFVSLFYRRIFLGCIAAVSGYGTIYSIHRTGSGSKRSDLREIIQSICAPVVTIAALVYGSIRYRSLLLI